jgi:hypothetical protein
MPREKRMRLEERCVSGVELHVALTLDGMRVPKIIAGMPPVASPITI